MRKILTTVIMVLVLTHVAPSMGQECNIETTINTNEKTELTIVNNLKNVIKATKKVIIKEKENYKTGYINDGVVDFRKKPKSKSKVVKSFYFCKKVKYLKYNKKWAKVRYKKKIYYTYLKYISKKKLSYQTKPAPSNNSIKSWMGYLAITNTASRQYKLQHSKAYTGKYGIRQVKGRYCIALGSYYTTTIGRYVDIILNNGTVIPCIIADCKADRDTDSLNRMHPDGSLVEFVVDSSALATMIRRMGDVSYACKSWGSRVSKVKIYSKTECF